jgi:two-component system sensor histidine kinase YesM
MDKKKLFTKGLSIRIALLVILTVCITFFSFVVLFFTRWIAQNTMKADLQDMAYSFQYNGGSELNLLFSKLSASAGIISQDDSIRHFFKTGDSDDISLENIAGIESFDNNETDSILLYRENTREIINIYGNAVELPSSVVLEKSKLTESAYVDMSRLYYNSEKEGMFLLCYYSNDGGYILIYIKESAISSLINLSLDSLNTKLLSRDSLCLSSSDKNDIGVHFPIKYDNRGISKISLFKNESSADIFTILTLDKTDTVVVLVNTVSYDKLYQDLYSINTVTIFIIIVMMIFLTVITVFISYRLIRPIENLNKDVKSYSGRDAKHHPHIQYNEITELYDSFDAMTERISQLIEKNQQDMEMQRKLELAALQVQINPHFLYNTLDTVAWLSKLKNQPEIEKLVVSLARFFRISLHKGDKYITVFEEIALIKNYVNIEKIRFPEKINLQLDVDDDIMGYRLVKIILQPIVENAIKHGFANLDRIGTITIKGYADGDDIIFEVTDDGVGFDVPDDFLSIERKIPDGPGGYGIKNVNERLLLEYGEGYGLFYESEVGKGTKVTVRIKNTVQEDLEKEKAKEDTESEEKSE